MNLSFVPIQLPRDLDTVLAYRRDAQTVSDGTPESFEPERYLPFLERLIHQDSRYALFLRQEEEPVGQMEISVKGDQGYIYLFYLLPDYRNQGLGKRLLDQAEQVFEESRCSYAQLRVSPTNHRAIAFYEKNGFVVHSQDDKLLTYRKTIKKAHPESE